VRHFDGFPANVQYAGIPLVFFSALLPEIDDMAELKATLYALHVLCSKKGYFRYVAHSELAGDATLLASLPLGSAPPAQVLSEGLNMAVERGTFLRLAIESGGPKEELYFLNTPRDREVVERLKNGGLSLPGIEVKPAPPDALPRTQPNIFTLYEQNIGMLTPIVAEEMKEAEKLYPEQWITDAFKEAVRANKRSWRFVAFLLERWATEGKKDGTYRRDLKATDPDKFVKDRYGGHFQR